MDPTNLMIRNLKQALSDINKFTIIHQNIRSFNKNGDDLILFLSQFSRKPDVIVISETWFSPTIVTGLEGYNCFHTFREIRKGGGISIFVKNCYDCTLLSDISLIKDDSELCSVKFRINNETVAIVGVYRPPDKDVHEFIDTISGIFAGFDLSCHVFLVGDLNIDLINPSIVESEFIINCYSYSYLPLVSEPTHVTLNKSSCLDHIWYNQVNDYNSGVIDLGISDHQCIFSSINMSVNNNSYNKQFRDHSPGALYMLSDAMTEYVNSFSIEANDDINFKTQNFLSGFLEKYNNCCPIRNKHLTSNRKLKPWINNNLITCINYKHLLFRQYKRGLINFDNYNVIKNFVTSLIRKAKSNYFNTKFKNNFNNPKETWKSLNSLTNRHKKRDVINEIRIGDETISESQKIAESFNEYFASIGSQIDANIPQTQQCPLEYMNSQTPNSFFVQPITSHSVSKIIHKLQNKSCDLQTIPIFIYKHCREIISPVIANLFNLSISQGTFPNCLKNAKIVPIFKAGDPHLMNNYRPISILPTLSKVFEKLMSEQLKSFIARNKLLSDHQFGFRENYNTSDAVLQFIDAVQDSLNYKKVTITVFLDFSKAFDTVNHAVLLKKLLHLGFRGVVYDWFKSYLSDRRQYVKIGQKESPITQIIMGVPQGSVLGPYLFLLYINDMQMCTKKLNLIHFADDTTAYHSNVDVDTLVTEINCDLARLNSWLICNRLSLNVNKTFYMLFTDRTNITVGNIYVDNHSISETSFSKFLGIIIDNKLSFVQHIDSVCKSVSRSFGVLRRISHLLPYKTRISIYYALIYSKVNYGIVAYGNGYASSKNQLHRLLYRAHKFLYPNPYTNDICPHKFLQFESIYEYFTAVKLFKSFKLEQHVYFTNCFNNLIPVHNYETRFHRAAKLNPPIYCKTKCQKSFLGVE